MFAQANVLKQKVMDIINTSKSIIDDIASLKRSISHLSSVYKDGQRWSVVNRQSAEKSSLTFESLRVSEENEHNDIYHYLFKIAHKYPSQSVLNHALRLSSKKGDSGASSILSVLLSSKKPSDPQTSDDDIVMKRLESNISSWISSYGHSEVLSEGKESILVPQFKEPERVVFDYRRKPELFKKKLNSDMEKCHILQSLS